MNAVIVIITILFISLLGYSCLLGFGFFSSKDKLLALGASYGLGVGLISMQLYIYSTIGIPWERTFLLIPWFILIAAILLKNRKKLPFSSPKIPPLKKIDKLLLLGILLSLLYVILEASLRPATAWDAWADWLGLAKAFFITGKITPGVLSYFGSVYPLTIDLLGTFTYIMVGRVDDTAVLLTSSAFYAFLALLFFASLRKKFGLRYALIFTLLLVSTQNFVRHGGRMEAGLADLPLGYYAFVSVMVLFNYFKDKSAKTFFLFNVFLSVTLLIKFEGVILTIFIAFCSLMYILNNKLYSHIPLFFVWILPYCFWRLDRMVMHLSGLSYTVTKVTVSSQKIVTSLWGTIKELVNVKSWNLLWIVYFYTLLTANIKKNLELAVLNFVILAQLFVYLLIYIFTTGYSPSSSIERLLMHIAPLAFYAVAIAVREKVKQYM